jgi:hypothetical protein
VVSHLPQREQARHLTQRFLDLAHHLYYCIDIDEFLVSLISLYASIGAHSPHDSSFRSTPSSLSSNRPLVAQIPLDELTRLLFVLSASALQVPPSYHLALGTASSVDLVQPRVDIWLDDAIACFDACHRQQQLSFPVLQAATIFLIWLGDRSPGHRFASILDASLRTAVQLGLDRLSNSAWDREFITTKLPMRQQVQPDPPRDASWAAKYLLQGDTKTRELGRAVWYALVLLNGASNSLIEQDCELATAIPGQTYHCGEYDVRAVARQVCHAIS